MTDSNIIQYIFDDNTIRPDGLVSITALANAYFRANGVKRDAFDWLSTKEATDSIAYLASYLEKPESDLVVVVRGGNASGTWVHSDLAEIFAQWISVEYRFAVVRLVRCAKEGRIESKLTPSNQLFDDRLTQSLLAVTNPDRKAIIEKAIVIKTLAEATVQIEDALSNNPKRAQFYNDMIDNLAVEISKGSREQELTSKEIIWQQKEENARLIKTLEIERMQSEVTPLLDLMTNLKYDSNTPLAVKINNWGLKNAKLIYQYYRVRINQPSIDRLGNCHSSPVCNANKIAKLFGYQSEVCGKANRTRFYQLTSPTESLVQQ